MSALVQLSQEGAVGALLLDRAEKRNALNPELLDAISDGLGELDRDPSVSVIVIRGAGPAFCAGYDISAGGDPERDARRERGDVLADWQVMQRHTARWLALRDLATPTIAAVHGFCIAGGAELALMCDLVIATEDAVIGHPVVRDLGVPTVAIYPYLVGLRRAKEMMLTGRCLSGVEAAEMGLVNSAVPVEGLEAEVRRYTGLMTAIPKPLLALNKRAVDYAFSAMGLEQTLKAGATLDALAHTTPEVRSVASSPRPRRAVIVGTDSEA